MAWTARTNLTGPAGPPGEAAVGAVTLSLDPNDPYIIILSYSEDETMSIDSGTPSSSYTSLPIDGGTPTTTYSTAPIDGGTP